MSFVSLTLTLDVKIFIFKLDVSDINQVKALKSSIPKEMQEIDVLVNNAGLALGMAHAHENDLVISKHCCLLICRTMSKS